MLNLSDAYCEHCTRARNKNRVTSANISGTINSKNFYQ
uniref:Uncharacterized protein n=1 Tax=Rhizophora mucronata TaxID=61149 RepID=A0A2P2P8F8_RHIMU